MTRQYIAGELSVLLTDLHPAGGEPLDATVDELRHQVEDGPPTRLACLAEEALTLADLICWAALEHGDPHHFHRSAHAAAALREFTLAARLLP